MQLTAAANLDEKISLSTTFPFIAFTDSHPSIMKTRLYVLEILLTMQQLGVNENQSYFAANILQRSNEIRIPLGSLPITFLIDKIPNIHLEN